MSTLQQIVAAFESKGYSMEVDEKDFAVTISGRTPVYGLEEHVGLYFSNAEQLESKKAWSRHIENIVNNPYRRHEALSYEVEGISHYEIFKDLTAFDAGFMEMWFAVMELPDDFGGRKEAAA